MSEQRIAEIRLEFLKGWISQAGMRDLFAAYDALSASPAETGQDRSQLFMDLGAFLHHRKGCEALDETPGACGCGLLAVSNQLLAALYGLKVPNVDDIELPAAETGRASETSGWRTFWGVIGPRGMPCLFGPHRDDVGVIDDDERIALFQVKEIAAPPPSASSATTTEHE